MSRNRAEMRGARERCLAKPARDFVSARRVKHIGWKTASYVGLGNRIWSGERTIDTNSGGTGVENFIMSKKRDQNCRESPDPSRLASDRSLLIRDSRDGRSWKLAERTTQSA
jgi:hypothetical protein